MKKSKIAVIVLMLVTGVILGGSGTTNAQDLKEKFKVVNRSIRFDKTSGSINLDEVDGAGIAWIKKEKFTTGNIEFDIKGKDELQQSFVGIAFHGLNDTTYESIYFRPFNFRATDPERRAHAVQYIALPGNDWPKLRSDFPGKYEQPVSSALDPNDWFHVKIVVSARFIKVYVNNSDQPVLEVESLAEVKGEMIGYWVGNGSGGDWKNLKISRLNDILD